MCVGYFWNPATCSKNGKYPRSISDSVVICNEIIEETKSSIPRTIATKSTSAKAIPTKNTSTNFYILLAFFINYHSIIGSY